VGVKERVDLISAVVGVATGIATFGIASALHLYPNLQPITAREVQITQISLEPSVSFDEYRQHTTRRLVPTGPESCVSRIRAQLASPSTLSLPSEPTSPTPSPPAA